METSREKRIQVATLELKKQLENIEVSLTNYGEYDYTLSHMQAHNTPHEMVRHFRQFFSNCWLTLHVKRNFHLKDVGISIILSR